MEKRKYAKVVSIRKLWHFWKQTLSYVSSFWDFSKICQISITSKWNNSFINFNSLDIRFFYLRWIKKVLALCNLSLYLEQKFEFINMVFSCDGTSIFRFSNSLYIFCMAHYSVKSSLLFLWIRKIITWVWSIITAQWTVI